MSASASARAHSDRIVPMRVIVCGVQRTGTLSLRHALFRLGFYDCHHMHSVRDNVEEQGHHWVRAIEAKFAGKGTEFTRQDWDVVLGDCQAVCDVPAAMFGPELAACYPDAKVVILNRDPDNWYDSVLNSIHSKRPPMTILRMVFCVIFDSATRSWLRFAMTLGNHAFGYNHRSEKDKALAWYKDIYRDFHERIPTSRRIDYSVGDGWGPLCEHLGVPVPQVEDEKGCMVEAPFPHLNDRAAFSDEMNHWWAKATARSVDNIFRLVGKAVVTGTTAYVGYLAWKTRLGGRL
ncbi:hypothetical protein ACRE_003560 [Hapsidospora chrysogenum ATCC 11550]|uniref:Uncharacterized protein n=1 Tax=Hapsidospora chrysogenum (strain ATCC 11550 / CBS 779.69 / DSM 880 / IAM 14645 / JCM 23072 / IMI 49137) TaxID=857340 RepID=A0A086TGW2_HAPC1|nr:hypothetical protein ACRE_003560 [Hapsidospora chrysogenum ATCC 11550]